MSATAIIELEESDAKARHHILQSLEVCAHNHYLSRMLLARLSAASGPILAIVGDWIKLDRTDDIDHTILPPKNQLPFVDGLSPDQRLVAFVEDYLCSIEYGVVICENWGWKPSHVKLQLWPPKRIYYLNDDVYHVLEHGEADVDTIERAVIPRHHWQTNLCTKYDKLPDGDALSAQVVDGLVRDARHVIVPAFDGSGYLIWSPARELANS